MKGNDNVLYLLKGLVKLVKEKQPSNMKFITNFPFVNSVLRYPQFSKERKVKFLPISGPCLEDVNYVMEAEGLFSYNNTSRVLDYLIKNNKNVVNIKLKDTNSHRSSVDIKFK